MNSTIRYFCDVFDVALFTLADALRISARRSSRHRHRHQVQAKICFYI
ncbi:hypothetical protein [Nostoc sp. UHCC 0251]|nr:hypothetical protein [Nostoc sp. UHCC 0251]MEA5626063.1 hypothetical protein [Nostoc sp. UHCC 0251]